MNIKENLPLMVLTQDSPDRLLFEFSSVLWGYVSLVIACVLGTMTYYAFHEADTHWIILAVLILFTLLFLYSSLYSFILRRTLEINQVQQVVKYRETGLYKDIQWHKDFRSFKLVRTFRPITTATSPGGRQAINWSIQLVSNEDEVFELGYNQFSALTRKKAEELLDRIVEIMHIEKVIIDD